jgi:hypothetical protein
MKVSGIICAVLAIGTAAALLAGCGGSAQMHDTQGAVPDALRRGPMPRGTWVPVPPTQRRAGWLSPAAKVPGQRLIYVSEEYASAVLIYPEKGALRSPIGTITTGVSEPWGLYVDKYRSLYVANQYDNTVTAYPSGATSPGLTYSKDLNRPLYPIVDRYGNVFVGNAGNGTVVEYLGGAGTSDKVIPTAGSEVDGMDFDQQGNLYVAYRAETGSSIEEFAPGSSKGTVLGMSLEEPQGLIVDGLGNILVVESGYGRIDVFPPGQQTPSLEVPVSDTPNQLALRQNRDPNLFIAAEEGVVFGVKYPFAKHPTVYVKDEADTIIQGVALSNGQHF